MDGARDDYTHTPIPQHTDSRILAACR